MLSHLAANAMATKTWINNEFPLDAFLYDMQTATTSAYNLKVNEECKLSVNGAIGN